MLPFCPVRYSNAAKSYRVGKTSIMSQLIKRKFSHQYKATSRWSLMKTSLNNYSIIFVWFFVLFSWGWFLFEGYDNRRRRRTQTSNHFANLYEFNLNGPLYKLNKNSWNEKNFRFAHPNSLEFISKSLFRFAVQGTLPGKKDFKLWGLLSIEEQIVVFSFMIWRLGNHSSH